MSTKHPIISVVGSSGAGTSTVKDTFEKIFLREKVSAAMIEGDAFHKFNRVEMKKELERRYSLGDQTFSHFSYDANLLEDLQNTFKNYGETGTAKTRTYVHNLHESELYDVPSGEFTEWRDLPSDTDLLFYEGLHGAAKYENINIPQYADLKIGVVPVINLEWIQKIHRDTDSRGYTTEAVTDTILRRMPDYINHICPQFSKTDINFQRIPTIDTSNPFICRNIPTPDESFVIIHFRKGAREKWGIDFQYLLGMINDSFMSSPTSIVVNGGKMGFAMELILTPIIHRLIEEKKSS